KKGKRKEMYVLEQCMSLYNILYSSKHTHIHTDINTHTHIQHMHIYTHIQTYIHRQQLTK
ncbi:hypothetical protein WUBG_15880, partial [Wuchereria bancrofti]